MSAPIRIFLVTGEHSGDALGAKLMAALRARADRAITFAGLGGTLMTQQGFSSLFPLDEVTVMGPLDILKHYPRLRRRALECVSAGVAFAPDIVVIIDAPEFTHPIARRIRARMPDVPIVNYVSPSVWAWRSGRARKMRPYVDHLLALLPFEPAAHARLGGPPCTYVGHPLVEQIDQIDAIDPSDLAERLDLAPDRKTLLILPGSRSSELDRLLTPFRETAARIAHEFADQPLQVVMPTLPRHRERLEAETRNWLVPVSIVVGEEDKWAAFKLADAALAASGTVTLELAVAGTPMVVAYRVDRFAAKLRFLVQVPSIVLANLVLDENAFPEFIQEDCAPGPLADALAPLLQAESPARIAQVAALARLRSIMQSAGHIPSDEAARVVLDVLNARPRQNPRDG